MTIIVTGSDGYLGWPTGLRIASQTTDRVLLVDNFARREWVSDVGSASATSIADIETRVTAAKEVHKCANLSFVGGTSQRERSSANFLMSITPIQPCIQQPNRRRRTLR